MIDPRNITNYNRTTEELEEFLLFCVAVAGKTAKQISKALDRFLNDPLNYIATIDVCRGYGDVDQEDITYDLKHTPFQKIRWLKNYSMLRHAIMFSKLGQHSKLEHAFASLACSDINLRTCSVTDLEQIRGIGPKTSRYFILHSRPNQRIACLDRHILRYMEEELGYDVPRAVTPKKYLSLEQYFIKHCEDIGRDIAEYDLEIWNRYSRN